jgi:hypothetical protein
VRLVLACLILSVCGLQAPVLARASAAADEFVEKLQLQRNPESVLQEILSRSEFKDSDRESLMDRARAWLSELRRRVFAWIWERIPSPNLPAAELDTFWTVLGSFVVAALLVVVAVLVWYSLGFFRSGQRGAQTEEELDLFERATSEDLRIRATRSAGEGNYREALIYLFRSVLLWLDERGKLSLHQVKTNREVLESLKNDRRLREVLGKIIPVFNRVRYGNYPCNRQDYEQFLAACDSVADGT